MLADIVSRIDQSWHMCDFTNTRWEHIYKFPAFSPCSFLEIWFLVQRNTLFDEASDQFKIFFIRIITSVHILSNNMNFSSSAFYFIDILHIYTVLYRSYGYIKHIFEVAELFQRIQNFNWLRCIRNMSSFDSSQSGWLDFFYVLSDQKVP